MIQPIHRATTSVKDFHCQRFPTRQLGLLLTAVFSQTKSQKIDPKVRNGPFFLRLQTVRRQNPGPNSKKRIFGPKSKILGPNNKNSLLDRNHVLATTGQRRPNLLCKFAFASSCKIRIFGQKRPNLAQNMHFWSFWAYHQPF